MSPSHESGYDDRTLTQYLLGRLPEDEAERIDEESLTEESLSWRLRAVEDDLIDAYVRGTLDAATQAQFEASYLTSPRRRGKVQLARDFLAAIDRAAVKTSSPEPEIAAGASVLPPEVHAGARPSSFWRFAAAAVVIVTIGGAAWWQQSRLRQELTQTQQDRNALDRRVQDLERELNDQRAANAQTADFLLAPKPAASSPAATDRSSAPAAAGADTAVPTPAIALVPQTRSTGTVDKLLVTAAGTPAILLLRLESSDFRRYRAALRDPASGRVIWRSAAVSPSSGTPVTVTVAVPSGVLKFQHYAIELSGLGATGLAGIVATYAFEVAPR